MRRKLWNRLLVLLLVAQAMQRGERWWVEVADDGYHFF